jgi:hypothetical protein
MRVLTGCWVAIAVASFAGCLQQTESYPLYNPAPPPTGNGSSGSSSSGGATDAGADACQVGAIVCSGDYDAGPDESCPASGTVTGTLASGDGGCSHDLVSVGGLPGDAGCCSITCLLGPCMP